MCWRSSPSCGGREPGGACYSPRLRLAPGMFVSAPTKVEFEREVSAIERVLAGREPTERRELALLVGARF